LQYFNKEFFDKNFPELKGNYPNRGSQEATTQSSSNSQPASQPNRCERPRSANSGCGDG
jgi:hypothetical protein